MKIAMLVPYTIFPPDEGGRVRAYNLLKSLSREHEMTLLTPRSPTNASCDLPIAMHETTHWGRFNKIVSPGFISAATRIFRKATPDVVLSEYPWPGLHGAYLSRQFRIPLVLDAPNVEGDRFRSTGVPYWRVVAMFERWVARRAERVFVVSHMDRERYVAQGVPGEKMQVVPNGIDPDAMHPDAEAGLAARAHLGIDDDTRLLLFFGQLDYAPNREALSLHANQVMPRLDAAGEPYRVVIAGKGDLAKLRALYPRMSVIGPVPSLVPYINAADAVLVPIRSGGGTRLKVLESVACGTPVISTSIGAEGIDASVCGDLLEIHDDWDEFAAAALKAPRGRHEPPAEFLDTYAWANIVDRIEWPAPGPR